MTIFAGACFVDSCPFNRPGVGVVCGWLTGPSKKCHHPTFREVWTLAHELEQAQRAEAQEAPVIPAPAPATPARPASLLSRVTAAQRPMDAATARQLLMDLGAQQ